MAVRKNSDEESRPVDDVTESAEEEAISVESVAKSGEKSDEESGFCVYIGPSVRGRVQYGTVFSSGSEARSVLEKELARFPALSMFLVNGKQLPQARIDVKTPGTALYIQAAKLGKELRKFK